MTADEHADMRRFLNRLKILQSIDHVADSFETIIDRIGNTRTATGLRVHAQLDPGQYPTGAKVTKSQMDTLALVPDSFHGEWNYALLPR